MFKEWVKGDHLGFMLNTKVAPTLAHLLGTDDLGRDQLSRVIFGDALRDHLDPHSKDIRAMGAPLEK